MVEPQFPLETERLQLRPFEPGDLDELTTIQSREDVSRYLYWRPRTRAEVLEDLQRRYAWTSLKAEGDALRLAVRRKGSDALLGDVCLIWVSEIHGQGEVGFVMHPAHHGQGYAGEAAGEMLRIGFEQLGLHRIVGRCDARNTASSRLMERLGMRREAHLVQNELVKGEWCDELVYAMLCEEWRTATGR